MGRSNRPALVPARKQPLFRQLESGIGREDIAASLVATGNPRASRLLDMMLDPAYTGLSFGQLCSRAGISAGEVMHLFLQRNVTEGLIRMARYLPEIMEDIALAAMGHTEPCGECVGTGRTGDSACPHCSGTGEIRMLGNLRETRLVLQAMGILGPSLT